MGGQILGSSNLPVIGANRCSRKWVNKTGHKILPMNQRKCLRLHLTENWAPNWFRKIAYLQRLMSRSLAISKNFTAHQNKMPTQYRSPEQLAVCTMITKNNLMCLMTYILKQRVLRLLVWNNAPPHIRRLSPIHLSAKPTVMLHIATAV